ncbi:hypothetical protein SARC_01737 [Sphaeroforma arctica JP610]|uniref:Uncharacterized protein n=1 Tax=Sphaeroforma arctica JP610 TaxID=667725 RepID=A0A0L0GB61_9EUKA|nr:hypothetical protein SARC_01737 [Sphaeroforma arctica JP610]KNC86121.1 hypothetical protein SARC_01737 [Sphaeroforma arctica JP610]|eukprot:XP_014160023.1 hypothetical protein SARC_01737 [Sphaeroforma arctica JP610]
MDIDSASDREQSGTQVPPLSGTLVDNNSLNGLAQPSGSLAGSGTLIHTQRSGTLVEEQRADTESDHLDPIIQPIAQHRVDWKPALDQSSVGQQIVAVVLINGKFGVELFASIDDHVLDVYTTDDRTGTFLHRGNRVVGLPPWKYAVLARRMGGRTSPPILLPTSFGPFSLKGPPPALSVLGYELTPCFASENRSHRPTTATPEPVGDPRPLERAQESAQQLQRETRTWKWRNPVPTPSQKSVSHEDIHAIVPTHLLPTPHSAPTDSSSQPFPKDWVAADQ